MALITSQEAHGLTLRVLKKTNKSANGIVKRYYPNPFKGYVSPRDVQRAFNGETLKLSIRRKFHAFRKEKLHEVMESCITVEEIRERVKKILSDSGITSVFQIKRKVKQNPFKGYAGVSTLSKIVKGEELSLEVINKLERYFKQKAYVE